MYNETRLPVRVAITTLVVGAIALMSACAIDPTNGVAGSGGVGSLGSECRCPTGNADCDGTQGQCAQGLVCRTLDSGAQLCTHDCPCPLNFICKAIGAPAQRLSCIKGQS